MIAPRPTSRIIKKERSKMVRQTVWFIGFAIILGLVFIAFILPNFVQFVDTVLNTNPIPVEEEEQLIQPPVLSAPVAATNSAELIVSGVAQAEQKITFVVNGEQSSGPNTSPEGNFSGSIYLSEGENTVTAFATTAKGTESAVGREYAVVLDTQSPTLEVSKPEDGASFSSKEKTIEVTGVTDPNTKVYLQDRLVFVKSDGTFSTSFSPSSGENKLHIIAVDAGGNRTEIERTIQSER